MKLFQFNSRAYFIFVYFFYYTFIFVEDDNKDAL